MPTVEKHVHYQEEEVEPWEFIFCFFFNAEAGVVIVTFAGVTLMITTFIHNLNAGSSDASKGLRAAQYFILTMFVFIMISGFVTGLVAVYAVKSKYSKLGSFILGIGMFMYILFTILSIIPSKSIRNTVCIDNRCPDHHWFLDAKWRSVLYESKGSSSNLLYIIISFLYTCLILFFYFYSILTFLGYGKHVDKYYPSY